MSAIIVVHAVGGRDIGLPAATRAVAWVLADDAERDIRRLILRRQRSVSRNAVAVLIPGTDRVELPT